MYGAGLHASGLTSLPLMPPPCRHELGGAAREEERLARRGQHEPGRVRGRQLAGRQSYKRHIIDRLLTPCNLRPLLAARAPLR